MRVHESISFSNDDLSEEELKQKALKESSAVVEIANCYPTALYYQANTITDESWYYFRINFPDDTPPIKTPSPAPNFPAAQNSKAPAAYRAGRHLHRHQSAVR